MKRLLPFLALLAIPGCSTRDFSQSWTIDRIRILAVKAEPAEPRPGDAVSFEALVLDPLGEVDLVIWFACMALEANDYGCEIDPAIMDTLSAVDPSTMSPKELLAMQKKLEAAGLIGAEPWLPPTYTVPPDVLDGLTDAERSEGANIFLQITALPDDATSDADMELAFKRVPVSESTTPNQNPVIEGVRISGLDVGPGVTLELDRDEPYTIDPIIPETSIERYDYTNEAGDLESREEEPYFTFFVQEGELATSYSIYPYNEVTWQTPAEPTLEEQDFWIVMQDRRGGMTWWTQHVVLR